MLTARVTKERRTFRKIVRSPRSVPTATSLTVSAGPGDMAKHEGGAGTLMLHSSLPPYNSLTCTVPSTLPDAACSRDVLNARADTAP